MRRWFTRTTQSNSPPEPDPTTAANPADTAADVSSTIDTPMNEPKFQDQTRICADCQERFIWTAAEQRWLVEQGFAATPTRRCKPCRRARRERGW
jgi:hypothetical protein